MRCTFFLGFALLAACDSGTGTGPGSDGGNRPDQAVSTGADLAGGGSSELGPQGTNGCKTLSACEFACNDNACIAACEAMATANAVNLFDTADQCRTDWCLGTNGVGTKHCVLDAMMNPIDPTGSPAGTCDDCLNDAVAMLSPAPSACITPSGPDCNPSACVPAQQACLNDLP